MRYIYISIEGNYFQTEMYPLLTPFSIFYLCYFLKHIYSVLVSISDHVSFMRVYSYARIKLRVISLPCIM